MCFYMKYELRTSGTSVRRIFHATIQSKCNEEFLSGRDAFVCTPGKIQEEVTNV